MELISNQYYHLYNRSNAREPIFKTHENYLYFLESFRNRFKSKLDVIAYCLMPTHFHFLIYVNTLKIDYLKNQIGIQLSSYTKAFNNKFSRNGSLFQQHTKTKHIDDDSHLLTLVSYIHQNPIRANLVEHLEDWPYSSYRDLAGLRMGTFLNKNLIQSLFISEEEFIKFSQTTVTHIKSKYRITCKTDGVHLQGGLHLARAISPLGLPTSALMFRD
ncbi:MAG: transposase [Candidatus Halalkalibacterium sp. M3_1C_030]